MSEETVGEVSGVRKKPRRMLIPILVIVIVCVASFGFFIWWFATQGGNPFAPSPEFNTYSKYGFSIEYPEEMTITEEGMMDATANDNSGFVWGESFGPYQLFGVSWEKSSTPLIREDLEAAVEEIFMSDSNFERKGTIVETTKSGHEMIIQHYTYTEDSEETYGIFGAWYCNVDEKLYVLGTEQTTEHNVLQIFEQYLDSFVCH